MKANDEEVLYAKIDENDIVKKISEEYKIDIQPHFFKLKKKITELGTYTVPFLYKEMKAELKVVVEEEKKEKSLHSSGKKIVEREGQTSPIEETTKTPTTKVKAEAKGDKKEMKKKK